MGRRRQTNRSPAYPFCDLESAVDLLHRLYEMEQFNYVPFDIAVQHWGLSPTSSTGQRTLAALSHFGLIDDIGRGTERKIRLSELGKRIVLGSEAETDDYLDALEEAFLKPRIYQLLWSKWGPDVPSDAVLARHLVGELGFNPNAVDQFIRDYRTSMDFAGLSGVEDVYDDVGGRIGTGRSQRGPQRKEEKPLEMQIPLVSGGRAVLQIPVPLTEDDFDLLLEMLELNLKMMKRALVRDSRRPVIIEHRQERKTG